MLLSCMTFVLLYSSGFDSTAASQITETLVTGEWCVNSLSLNLLYNLEKTGITFIHVQISLKNAHHLLN